MKIEKEWKAQRHMATECAEISSSVIKLYAPFKKIDTPSKQASSETHLGELVC